MDENIRHKKNMQSVKQDVDKLIKESKKNKGLIIILTGDGKGKSSSAFGMALRFLGHNKKIGVVQFIKGKWDTGEKQFFERNPNVKYFANGEGFTWETQNKTEDIKRAESCLKKAEEFILDEELDYVILDELNVVLSFNYLDLNKTLEILRKKPEKKHIAITGRNAPKEILEIADTISEIDSPKHAFEQGIKAQLGIEF